MYAVVASGGQQYRVKTGDVICLEKLPQEVGDVFEFPEVLMIANGDKLELGMPLVSKGKVKAEVLSHGRGKKIEVLKFKRRKKYMRRQGHRQSYTEVKITDITDK